MTRQPTLRKHPKARGMCHAVVTKIQVSPGCGLARAWANRALSYVLRDLFSNITRPASRPRTLRNGANTSASLTFWSNRLPDPPAKISLARG